MADIEKVMEALERCSNHDGKACLSCPYNKQECVDDLCADALKLLKWQQQKYWTLEHDWKMLREKISTQTNAQKSALDVR